MYIISMRKLYYISFATNIILVKLNVKHRQKPKPQGPLKLRGPLGLQMDYITLLSIVGFEYTWSFLACSWDVWSLSLTVHYNSNTSKIFLILCSQLGVRLHDPSSNGGIHFPGSITKEICKALPLTTKCYCQSHPQSSGKVERRNTILKIK